MNETQFPELHEESWDDDNYRQQMEEEKRQRWEQRAADDAGVPEQGEI